MKTLIITLAVASFVATSATPKTAAQTNYADGGHIYRSSQSRQNPDGGPYPAFRGPAFYYRAVARHRGSHSGKRYSGTCTYIGGWVQGYPGTGDSC
jgi:hypothetical protein